MAPRVCVIPEVFVATLRINILFFFKLTSPLKYLLVQEHVLFATDCVVLILKSHSPIYIRIWKKPRSRPRFLKYHIWTKKKIWIDLQCEHSLWLLFLMFRIHLRSYPLFTFRCFESPPWPFKDQQVNVSAGTRANVVETQTVSDTLLNTVIIAPWKKYTNLWRVQFHHFKIPTVTVILFYVTHELV